MSADACSAQMYAERRETLAYTVAGVGALAGAVLLGPALLNSCAMNPAVCTELSLTAVELPFGAATAGGTALGVGGFGSLAAKEVAATADAAAAARVAEGAKAIPESSYPSLAKPSPNAPSNVILGELDSLGRPTGVTAVLREDSLGGGSSANPAIRPPGFEGQPANHARGHLLANSLGGAGDDARNLVTLFQRNANHPNMSSFERQVRGAVQSGETVSYRAVPIYTGTNPMPTGVTLSARGSGGFTLDVSIPNVSGVK